MPRIRRLVGRLLKLRRRNSQEWSDCRRVGEAWSGKEPRYWLLLSLCWYPKVSVSSVRSILHLYMRSMLRGMNNARLLPTLVSTCDFNRPTRKRCKKMLRTHDLHLMKSFKVPPHYFGMERPFPIFTFSSPSSRFPPLWLVRLPFTLSHLMSSGPWFLSLPMCAPQRSRSSQLLVHTSLRRQTSTGVGSCHYKHHSSQSYQGVADFRE